MMLISIILIIFKDVNTSGYGGMTSFGGGKLNYKIEELAKNKFS